jgi:hypothetical protein
MLNRLCPPAAAHRQIRARIAADADVDCTPGFAVREDVAMEERPSDRFMSSEGTTGWYAYPPDGRRVEDDDTKWDGPREGSLIRFMGEHTVRVPLWGEDGLIFSDSEELTREWDVSAALAADILAWAVAWQKRSGQADHDAEASQLVRRLSRELEHRFQIVYQP